MKYSDGISLSRVVKVLNNTATWFFWCLNPPYWFIFSDSLWNSCFIEHINKRTNPDDITSIFYLAGGNEVFLSFWTASVRRQGHKPGQVKLSHRLAQRAGVTVGGSRSTRGETDSLDTERAVASQWGYSANRANLASLQRRTSVPKKKRYHHPEESKMNSSCWLWLDDGPPDHVEKHANPSFIAEMDRRCSRNLAEISPHKKLPFCLLLV